MLKDFKIMLYNTSLSCDNRVYQIKGDIMDDLEKFIKLYKSVEQEVSIIQEGICTYDNVTYDTRLQLTGKKYINHMGFFTALYFLDGKYMGCGSWE